MTYPAAKTLAVYEPGRSAATSRGDGGVFSDPVYGVLSYAVSQRRSEVGVRMALGASNRSVLRLIVAQGMRPVVIGLVIGTAGALWLSRAMSTLLFDMTAADWPTYAGVAMLLAGAVALACYVPARSALRVDVTATLREE